MSITKIVPGQVINNGIEDGSLPVVVPQLANYPCTFPVLSMVTPKGQFGQKYINIGDFGDLYGNIQNTETPYYNPLSVLIHSLAFGGQASIGVRRLSANKEVSRSAVAVKIIKRDIQQYERMPNQQFKINELGKRIPIEGLGSTLPGLTIEHVILKPGAQGWEKGVGGLVTVTGEEDGVTTTLLPLYELSAGVGDHYNQMGHYAGLNPTADFTTINRFVKDTGVYPFGLKLYERTSSGIPVLAKTITSSIETTFTLFDVKDSLGVRYGLNLAIGNYTGRSSNRPMVPRAAPFESAYLYKDNVEELLKTIYQFESEHKPDNLVYKEGVEPHKQMNPFTAVNHDGVPYFTVEVVGETRLFNLNSQINSHGGISPFLNKDGKVPEVNGFTPEYFENKYDFSDNPDPMKKIELTRYDAWKISQSLILADIMEYRRSLEIKDWTRNRQSIIFDVGYNSEIKEELIQLLNTRKDQIGIFSDHEWLEPYTIEQRYSTRQFITNRLRLIPESALAGTPSCRASTVLWSMKKIDEESGEDFGHVMDLATAFARFGGNARGILMRQFCPDHGNNRILGTMFDPTVDLEDDELGAANFDLGAITLRPYNQIQVYRPALPTVYPYANSVLKDLTTNFTCICAEKIIADTWTLVSGDTTISAEQYASIVKDRAEERIRNNLGTMIAGVEVRTFYVEGTETSRAVLHATGYIQFNKGKYMLIMNLVALNEQDQAEG